MRACPCEARDISMHNGWACVCVCKKCTPGRAEGWRGARSQHTNGAISIKCRILINNAGDECKFYCEIRARTSVCVFVRATNVDKVVAPACARACVCQRRAPARCCSPVANSDARCSVNARQKHNSKQCSIVLEHPSSHTRTFSPSLSTACRDVLRSSSLALIR